jgi:Ca2+-binding RTX toxin-like protein
MDLYQKVALLLSSEGDPLPLDRLATDPVNNEANFFADITYTRSVWKANPQNYTVQGTAEDDVIISGGKSDVLLGGFGNDTLGGSGASDLIDGGAGNDTLIGDSGNDIYRYNALSEGFDTIIGFGKGDNFDFSRFAFGDGLAKGGANTGTLDPSHFVANSTGPTNASQEFWYNTDTHILYYDVDRSGLLGVPVAIAQLDNGFHLSNTDVHLI